MSSKLYPVGNRIMVKRISKEVQTKTGILLTNNAEKNGNAWGEIIALPIVSENLWIKEMKVGDRILYKRFSADNAIDLDLEDDFEVVDVEPNDGVRPGQVLAHEPKI